MPSYYTKTVISCKIPNKQITRPYGILKLLNVYVWRRKETSEQMADGEEEREEGRGVGRGQKGEKVGSYINVFGECGERKEDNITSWIP